MTILNQTSIVGDYSEHNGRDVRKAEAVETARQQVTDLPPTNAWLLGSRVGFWN